MDREISLLRRWREKTPEGAELSEILIKFLCYIYFNGSNG